MFTTIDYSDDKFKEIISRTINKEDIQEFMNLINKPYISISGSSILELITNDEWESADIDIYINITTLNNPYDLLPLMIFLLKRFNNINKHYSSNRYTNLSNMNYVNTFADIIKILNNNIDDASIILTQYMKYGINTNDINNMKLLSNILKNNNLSNDINKSDINIITILSNMWMYLQNKIKYENYKNNISHSKNYTSLGKYLKYYLSLINDNNKKIELIFTSCDIETLLLNTFDYDVVKNYWKQNKVYVNNMHNIEIKIGCMNLQHFIIRIMKNINEFENFVTRYNKYTQRGYKLFIHKTLITNSLMEQIYNIRYNTIRSCVRYNNLYKKLDYITFKMFYKYKVIPLKVEKISYITKVILITGIYNKYITMKKLKLYSKFLLNEEYIYFNSLNVKTNSNANNDKNIYSSIADKIKLLKLF